MKSESRLLAIVVTIACALMTTSGLANAADIAVTNDVELASALTSAKRGDAILLSAGTYKGDIYAENLQGVTIRSADPARRATIVGGKIGIHLVNPVDVVLQSLVFSRQLEGGINIDDGGTLRASARGIWIEHVSVLNIVRKGNHDGIKLAGVQDLVIKNVTVDGWGDEGSAIDFVGVHRALIESALLRHPGLGLGGSAIRVKGGSKSITVRANRIELPIGKGRAIQAGGYTSPEFFRFADGDRDYEAAAVRIEGNVVSGGASAFSWVNIDGGVAHRNLVYRPGQWVIRILNENPGGKFITTQNGRLHDNRIVFNDTDNEFNTAVNVGPETLPETFGFARNSWLNLARPTPEGSRPRLPVAESDGIYAATPAPSIDAVQVWEMPWGKWVVNATTAKVALDPRSMTGLKRATPGRTSWFDALAQTPLAGEWTTSDPGMRLELEPMSHAILVAAASAVGAQRPPPLPARSTTPPDAHLTPKEAFEAAKELNSIDGWQAFLRSYPDGFLADMARAYIKQLERR